MSTTFSANFGAFDSLNGRVRCGLRPCSFQNAFARSCGRHRSTSANMRALQCVACFELLLAVRFTIARPPRRSSLLVSARALPPVLEQALDATIHVGFLPASNRQLRYPPFSLDAIRPHPLPDSIIMPARATILCCLAISDEPLQCRPVHSSLTHRYASMFRMPPFNLICRPLRNPIIGPNSRACPQLGIPKSVVE